MKFWGENLKTNSYILKKIQTRRDIWTNLKKSKVKRPDLAAKPRTPETDQEALDLCEISNLERK
jgi:hypothetical protein